MQKVNAIGKVWKMKGRALHMAANTCEVVHRQRKGWEGKGEGGWFRPHTLRFRSALEIFRCLFLSFSRFLSLSSISDSRTFLMEAAA